MFQKRMLWTTGLGLALLAPSGCYDFDGALAECELSGRCQPPPVGGPGGPCQPTAVDLPDDAFQDTNCDGVDGTASAALFVDPTDGQDIHRGTPEAPLQTLSRALQVAKDRGLRAIYLAQGTYDEPELELDTPVSLHGGYAGLAGGWARGNNHLARIGGGSIGLTLRELGPEADVTIERVRITSAQGASAGAPSIGMRVLRSSGVKLRYVEIQAGAGAPGAPGASPESPVQSAASGSPGKSQVQASNNPPAEGGAPGLLSCGDEAQPGATGGNGGTQSVNATAGASSASAEGGTAGTSRFLTGKNVCPTATTCHCQGEPGGKGQDGLEGASGRDGAAGSGLGLLEPSTGTWSPTVGEAGGAGSRGGGGAGGGGGGYCNMDGTFSEGGGGGGGGAGGCPGLGAEGGGGGGASIALLLVGGQVELDSVILKTAGGGQGGAGGTGSPGSPGGQGGDGGTSYTREGDTALSPVPYATGGTGGQGGTGGPGGRGGHGGNGAGGPSVGIWCDAPSTSSALEKGSVSYSLGEPGPPGSGPGLKDETVHKYARHQCPPAR